jgi:LmbE family N-acetylglucosaminyl deacetylase
MTTVLMLASFGLEIVECGGTLAAHLERGDKVYAAVTLSRPQSRPQVVEAAKVLGISEVEFLDFPLGDWEINVASKEKIVRLIRKVRPDIVILQDPEHAQHDLDPDRRLLALLYTESFSVSGRDWHVEACGGYEPFMPHAYYYMSPLNANCIVEISKYFDLKEQALAILTYQLAFSAQSMKLRAPESLLRSLVPNYDELVKDDAQLGLALTRQLDTANALWNGLAGHSGAVMGEAYRREGLFVIEHLPK